MTTLFALIALATATPSLQHANPTMTDAWSQIEQYIDQNATSVDQATVDLIHSEALAGIETWVVVGTSGLRSQRHTMTLAPVKTDGGGVGWPQTNSVVNFPSSAQAQTLAAMIDVYVAGGGASAKN